jgi:pilus assembly protein CpaB
VRFRTWLIGVLSLVFGGSAAVGVHAVRSQPGEAKADTVEVIVAAADVPRGTTISESLVKKAAWPRDLVPPGAILAVPDACERTALVPFVKDEPVLDGKLAVKGAGRGMAALIPKGMRAFAIQTPNVASGVAGFILPGNKVDVLLTVSSIGNDDATGGGTTTTLLQHVEVLAIDQRIDAPADNKVDPKEMRSVTLLVTPDEAAKLDLGQNKGTLHLSLRNPEDKATGDTQPATLAGLRFTQEPASQGTSAPEAAPVEPRVVAQYAAPTRIRTLRGRHGSEVTVHPFVQATAQ